MDRIAGTRDDLPDLVVIVAGVLLLVARLGLVASVSSALAFALYGWKVDETLPLIVFGGALALTIVGSRLLRIRLRSSLTRAAVQAIAFSGPVLLFFVARSLIHGSQFPTRDALIAVVCALTWIGYVALRPRKQAA